MQYLVTEDFYYLRMYRAQEIHDFSDEEIARLKQYGQFKRLKPLQEPQPIVEEQALVEDEPDYTKMLKAELVAIAESLGIEDAASLTKADLTEAILAKQGS
jgi:hypothetical protein